MTIGRVIEGWLSLRRRLEDNITEAPSLTSHHTTYSGREEICKGNKKTKKKIKKKASALPLLLHYYYYYY